MALWCFLRTESFRDTALSANPEIQATDSRQINSDPTAVIEHTDTSRGFAYASGDRDPVAAVLLVAAVGGFALGIPLQLAGGVAQPPLAQPDRP